MLAPLQNNRSGAWVLSAALVCGAVMLSVALDGSFTIPERPAEPLRAPVVRSAALPDWEPRPSVAVNGWLPTSRRDATPAFDVRRRTTEVGRILDMLPAVDDIASIDRPRLVAAEEAGWLTPGDEVIGISTGRHASRCYPLGILRWHNVVNDALDGRPIAILYDPLSGATLGFSREVAGQVRRFGVSGKAYKGCALLYDRTNKSLWHPISGACIAGPDAGGPAGLSHITVQRTTWACWRRRHRRTEVLSRNTGLGRPYGTDPYARQDHGGPVDALAGMLGALPADEEAGGGVEPGKLVLGVRLGQQAAACVPPDTRPEGPLRRNISLGGARLRVTYDARTTNREFSVATSRRGDVTQLVCYWGAWRAAYPDTETIRLQD